MTKKNAEKLVPVMIRFTPLDHESLRQLAHEARVPLATFCKSVILTGKPPVKAPPAHDELAPEAKQMLAACHSLISNLAQLATFCSAAGEPLCRLAGDSGALAALQRRARDLGMQAKVGHADAASLARLRAPSDALNELAKAVNSGHAVAGETFSTVLQDLHSSLPETS